MFPLKPWPTLRNKNFLRYYLKDVLLRECGEEVIPDLSIEGLVRQLVRNIASGDKGLLADVHDNSKTDKVADDVDSLVSRQQGELTMKAVRFLNDIA